MRLASIVAAAVLLIASTAHATDARAVVAVARQRIETADYRATGRLVRVDASGSRVNNAITIKAHWFPGILRALVEIVPPPAATGNAHPDARVRILLEMRPNGQNSIRIFHPHESAPASLPFDRWSESIFGSGFNYEDFLQQEFYWQGQMILKRAKFGSRDCDVLKSTPGALDHSHYEEVQTWFDHIIGYPVYAEKTLKNGRIVKEFTSFGLRQSGGVWSASQVEVKTRGRAGSTLLIIERGSTKAKLSTKDFSPEEISHFEGRP
jgi:hypothetical protein